MARRASRLVAAIAAFAVGITLTANAALASPPPPRAMPPAVVRGLRLTAGQQTNIRRIIDRSSPNGMPTIATQRAVLRELTPDQRARLQRFIPAAATAH